MLCYACKQKEGKYKLHGQVYCKDCFLRLFERSVKRCVKKWKLIEANDRIALAVSGGKDSMVMLHVISKIASEYENVELFPFHLILGIDESYELDQLKHAIVNCEALGLKLLVISAKLKLGKSLNELLKVTKRKPCSLCGMIKRYLMNRVAYELRCNKLATAHNASDVVTFFLQNMLSKNLDYIASLSPLAKSTHEKMVTRIKPLFLVTDSETKTYAELSGIMYAKALCKYKKAPKVRKMLDILERDIKGFSYRMAMSITEIAANLTRKEKPLTCKLCGFPSSSEVCGVCRILRKAS